MRFSAAAARSFLKQTASATAAITEVYIAAFSPWRAKPKKVFSLYEYWAKLARFSMALPPETRLSANRWLIHAGNTGRRLSAPASAHGTNHARALKSLFASAWITYAAQRKKA